MRICDCSADGMSTIVTCPAASCRADGTGVRLMRATYEIISTLHTFKPASLNKPLSFSEMLKDRDTHPETGQLVASRICLFEVRPYFLIVR